MSRSQPRTSTTRPSWTPSSLMRPGTHTAIAPSRAADPRPPSGLVAEQRASSTRAPGAERSAGAVGHAQCRSTPGARSDREGVWHLQALLWPAPHALARLGQGGLAGQARGDGLQPAPELGLAGEGCGVSSARILPGAGSNTLPETRQRAKTAHPSANIADKGQDGSSQRQIKPPRTGLLIPSPTGRDSRAVSAGRGS